MEADNISLNTRNTEKCVVFMTSHIDIAKIKILNRILR